MAFELIERYTKNGLIRKTFKQKKTKYCNFLVENGCRLEKFNKAQQIKRVQRKILILSPTFSYLC